MSRRKEILEVRAKAVRTFGNNPEKRELSAARKRGMYMCATCGMYCPSELGGGYEPPLFVGRNWLCARHLQDAWTVHQQPLLDAALARIPDRWPGWEQLTPGLWTTRRGGLFTVSDRSTAKKPRFLLEFHVFGPARALGYHPTSVAAQQEGRDYHRQLVRRRQAAKVPG